MKAVAQRDAGHGEGEERADLEPRAPVLHAGRLADAADVHGGHGGDHGDPGQLVRRRRERDELTQVVGERHRERRGPAGVDRQEQGPADQEGGEGAECFAHVDVAATGIGQHGAELTERERAEQCQDAPQEPDEQRHTQVSAGLAQHCPRHREDPRADRRPDDDEDQVA